MKIEEQIKVIIEAIGENVVVIENSDDLFGHGILDSLSVLVLISKLQENFNVEINFEDLIPQNLESVDAISRMVERYLESK